MAEQLFAKFIGFIVSFLVIAMYWANHHLLFGYLEGTNRRLIWAAIVPSVGSFMVPTNLRSRSQERNWFPLFGLYSLTGRTC
jgi:uncharacterized membrane protein